MTTRQMQKNTERMNAKSVCNFVGFSVYQWDLASWLHHFIPAHLAVSRILNYYFSYRKDQAVKSVKCAKNNKKYTEQWNSYC